jgi:hypothetical protein
MKTCGKTMAEMGRHQEDPLLLWNIRGWRRLAEDRDFWRQSTEGARV